MAPSCDGSAPFSYRLESPHGRCFRTRCGTACSSGTHCTHGALGRTSDGARLYAWPPGARAIAVLPAPIFNLVADVAAMHMLAMMAITARIGLQVMRVGLQVGHLFAAGLLATVMVMFLRLIFGFMGAAVYRDQPNASA